MTPKTEAASLGEQIISKSGEIEVSSCIAGMYGAAPFTIERERRELRELVARLVALATSEPPAPQANTDFCCEHSWSHAKQLAWKERDLNCGCDHCESCEKCWPLDFRAGGKWAKYTPQAVGERLPLTDEQIVKAARVLNDRASAECGVDKDDMWKTYGESYLADVIAIEAALKEPT